MAGSPGRTRTYRIKPTKQQAVLTTVMGIGLLVWAIIGFSRNGKVNAFLVIWCLLLVGIVGFNLWAAFSKRGYTNRISLQEEQLEPDDAASSAKRD